MPSISTVSLKVPVQNPTIIGLDFPLITLIGLTDKRKQFLTCTQKIVRAKLERLRLTRVIQRDQKITSRNAEVLTILKDS
jgi:hypothetical protein